MTRRTVRRGKPRVAARALQELSKLVEAVERGEPLNRRFTVDAVSIPDPSMHRPGEIRALRKRLNVSQTVFAAMLGVSVQLVQAWEQGLRRPQPWARRLLDSLENNQSVLKLVSA